MEVERLSQGSQELSDFAGSQCQYLLLSLGEGCKMKIKCRRRLICLMSSQEQSFIAVKC